MEMPDDLYSFFMIDCAFGYKSGTNFLRLDQIPNGRLRRGVEERISKHYNDNNHLSKREREPETEREKRK